MTYRLPPLNSLKAFEAAARNQSFKIAATELGVTAGAVSQLVKKLELALSVELFTRLSSGLVLTQKGQKYFERVDNIFELITDATDEIAPDHNGRKFSVGVAPDIFAKLPQGWIRSTDALRHSLRDVVENADASLVWDGQLDGIVVFDGSSREDLCSRTIIDRHEEARGREVVFQSKPGLVNCRQSDEIISSLRTILVREKTAS
jgi:LysR family glycine cleavage system transcriptional activator